MRDIWFTSDHHFGHANILTFRDGGDDESPLIRPGFTNVEHMNEYMIDAWNMDIKNGDIVYHLGDIAWRRNVLDNIMPRLNGSKRLLLGNHDKLDVGVYRKYFQKIGVARQFVDAGAGALICSHYPLHPNSLLHRYKNNCINVHGHIHQRAISDPRYFNVSVERTNYRPVHYDTLIQMARELT